MREPARTAKILETVSNAADGEAHPRAHHGAFLRRLAFAGARHGPAAFVRYSPPLFGAVFALALGDVRERVRDNLRAVRGRRAPLSEGRDVVRHVVETHGMFLGFVGDDLGDIPSVDDDPRAAWDAARAVVQDRLDDPARAAAEFDGALGRTSFETSVDRFLSSDLVMHGWDLARAIGR